LNINNRHPPLWILIYGLVIIAFGIFLLIIGSGIRVSLIFIVIGLSLIALWLYLDIRKEKRQKKRGVYVNITQACICLICDHKETKTCLQQKCACCLIMKGNDIIGHHSDNNSLQ
jgi:hypothetical protein